MRFGVCIGARTSNRRGFFATSTGLADDLLLTLTRRCG